MLKSQDIVLLLKIFSALAREKHLSQNEIAVQLCISVSEVNAAIKRLCQSGLLRKIKAPDLSSGRSYLPIVSACEEFLISGVKYVFPAQLGEYTYGLVTSYAAPIFKKKIALGQDPVPVWPFVEGQQRGLALAPLYSSVPKSLTQYPDQDFYDLLVLLDAIRQGRARERNIAVKMLKEKLHEHKSK